MGHKPCLSDRVMSNYVCRQTKRPEKPIGEFIHPKIDPAKALKWLFETIEGLGARVPLDLEPIYGKPSQCVVLAPIVGLEPTTLGLTVPRSTS